MPSAQADLEDYAAYIAKDSERYATEWLSQAWKAIFSLADRPERFEVIAEADELGAPLRDELHYSHRIVYLVKEDAKVVEIIRVYHGARRPLTRRDLD